MKSRIIKWMFLILGIVLISTLCYRYRYHHRVASDYERFLNSLRIDLPKVAEAESWDNYDRGASRWDCLEHVIRFENSLSDKTVTKLDRLCERNRRWSKEENPNGTIYEYRSEREWNSDLYFFSCRLQDDKAWIEYYIDEDEGLFIILLPFLLIALALFGLVIWLLVSVIINIVKALKSRNRL